eukprot:CAMPEP_0185033602 /NCGR_PEP_ID=MMETSP1103-20130426/22691_1 /TAXON_ID=36769 /ORGANISM="Paraphysomonas bandaiensis, Strain Caron Lab Isolate" /LENGTH=82 /DNA_ID=CAMNT_0027569935 /DNA_START=767 /DNA_END=1015 /DNA_ORIENTATION=-
MRPKASHPLEDKDAYYPVRRQRQLYSSSSDGCDTDSGVSAQDVVMHPSTVSPGEGLAIRYDDFSADNRFIYSDDYDLEHEYN